MEYDLHDIAESTESYLQAEREQSAKWERALEIAKQAHKGQLRDEGTPYFNHVHNVAERIEKITGKKSDLAVVALLHDTIEDSDITYDYLAKEFDKHIATNVQVLSKVKGVSLEDYLQGILDSRNSFLPLVKLCDRIDNINSLKKSPNAEKRERYLDETKNIFIPLFENASAETKKYYYSDLMDELKTAVEKA